MCSIYQHSLLKQMKGMLTFHKRCPRRKPQKFSEAKSALSANSQAGVLKPLEDITYNKTVKWVELELRDFCACYSKREIADVMKVMCKLQGCQMKK